MNQEGNKYRRLRALPAGAACQAIDSDLLQGQKEGTFEFEDLGTQGVWGWSFISASAVPHRG